MNQVFYKFFKKIKQNKIVFAIALLLLIILAWFPIRQLNFEENINDLAPNNKKVQEMSHIFSNSSLMDKIVISISAENTTNTDTIINYAKELSNQIHSQLFERYLKEIRAEVSQEQMINSMDFMFAHLPVYLNQSDYVLLDSILCTNNIEHSIKSDFRALMTPANFGIKKFIQRDPLNLNQFAMRKLQELRAANGFEIIDNFIFTKDKDKLLIFIELKESQNTKQINEFDTKLSEIIAQLNNKNEYKNISTTYFGGPLVANGNANQIKKDIILTVTLAMVLLLLLISYYFRSKRALFIIFVPAVLGALFSISIISLITDSISMISLGVGSVLIGISVDFALHIYSHYRKNNNLEKLFEDISQPILISAATTSAAFMSLMALQSKVISDLGMFLGISILFSAFFSLFLFPLLLPRNSKKTNSNNFIDRIAKKDISKIKYVVLSILILSTAFYFMRHQTNFTSDLSKNNYMSNELKQAEKEINSIIGLNNSRNMFVASKGETLEQALQQSENIENNLELIAKDKLSNYQINSSKLTPSLALQESRIKLWNNFWTKTKRENINNKIISEGNKYGFKASAFNDFYKWLNSNFTTFEAEKSPLYSQFVKDFVVKANGNYYVLNQLNVDRQSTKQDKIINQFKNSESIIVDKLYFTKLLMSELKIGFDNLAFYALILVFLILLISYGRIELAIISFIPVSLTWLWILSGMNLFGLEFNIFNVVVISFVFGLGIDYSVFYMQSLVLKHKYGHKQSNIFRASILLSALTSIIGIGVLVLAKHPAMRSIALTSIMGISIVVLLTFAFIPAAFRWLTQWSKGKRTKVITLYDTVTSLLFFFFYVSGSMILTLLIPIFVIFPLPSKKKKMAYHYLVMIFSRYVALHPSHITKKINYQNETFDEPSVIISNHQSVVDVMFMLGLHPKILIITNERVWKHWLWGAVLRYADYFPSSGGLSNMQDLIKEKVKEGFSIMVFPEGTRSMDGKIRRFHKGAFMLAKELNLPILPILLHGLNEGLRKGEFFLFASKNCMEIMERIPLEKLPYDQGVSAVAKYMTQFYRTKYTKHREKYVGVDYYSIHLTRNFIYKGPVLEWYFKIKFRMEDKYRNFDKWIPRKARIIDLGCGYGFLDLMLTMISPERQITAVDFDEEKINLAQNSAIKNESLNFVVADVTEYKLENADVFLILDTLHYFNVKKQISLITSCITHLNKNGMILIRDANTDIKTKHKSTELTEKLSTGIGFNKANYSDMEFVSANILREIAEKNNMNFEILDESQHLSNIIVKLTHK